MDLQNKMSQYQQLSFEKIETYSIKDRLSKVRVEEFAKPLRRDSTLEDYLEALPEIFIGRDFRTLVGLLRKAIAGKNEILWMMGAHVIKCGMNPLIIELLKKRVITHLAVNGACVIHDTEVSMWGQTSEDVAKGLEDGSFGMAKETSAFINGALSENKANDKGYGEVVGEALIKKNAPNRHLSILATCVEQKIPLSVHPALGTEIIHQHPNLDGAAFGEKALIDFRIFTHSVSKLRKDSVVLNVGSAVILPEVFLKALTVVRNLKYETYGFHTAVFDMIRHYRPTVNVQNRPTQQGGEGLYIVGHHEMLIPLLTGLIL